MKKNHLVVPLVLLMGMTAAACGSTEDKAPQGLQDKVKVGGQFGEKPSIEIDAPLKVSDSTSWTATKGDGDKVADDATAILQLTLADGTSGKTAISTHDQGQRPLEAQLSGGQVFPSLVEALTGKPAGSRVVVASTSDDAYGDQGAPQIGIKGGDPVVMVADVLSTDPTSVLDGPTGATIAPKAGAPKLLEKDGVPTGFDFTGTTKPKKLVVVPLREGTGPAVEAPDRVEVNYLGQVWNAKKPFQASYGSQTAKFSVGLDAVIPGWDQGLPGVKEGGRVLLLIPAAQAYGTKAQPGIPANSTLAFVVDVLGVG